MQLAGFDPPVAFDLEILDHNGEMAHGRVLVDFSRRFGLKLITIETIALQWSQSGRAQHSSDPIL
jgi:3,4-dihydroxy-2-butanone 4-phosphate synthase